MHTDNKTRQAKQWHKVFTVGEKQAATDNTGA